MALLVRRQAWMLYKFIPAMSQIRCSGEWGSGAGKGGGSGGSVRDAGGSFGKMEAAREEEYFRKKQKEQLQKLKEHLDDEIHHHENLIDHLEDEIKRHKERISSLKKQQDDSSKH
ncbi:ATPase inhibitor mai-2, mitochondrial-like [Centruroides vittatus]|uniref:ATPase inhibitor mai-2, mitochondrial-like n=1 Tax=Centruroides vittatus TaxID=120091 RepID=UPI0035107AE3